MSSYIYLSWSYILQHKIMFSTIGLVLLVIALMLYEAAHQAERYSELYPEDEVDE